MAHLVPSISFVSGLKDKIQCGHSLATAVDELVLTNEGPFFIKLHSWWVAKKSGHKVSEHFSSEYQAALIQILDEGLNGAPIYQALQSLEQEMLEEFERQWKAYLERLPVILSLPLLFLFFPAYVILLFGPLLNQFLIEVNL